MQDRYRDIVYGAGDETGHSPVEDLGTREIRMITGAFQFQLATVTPSGWPYLQYRSGPPGFLHHLGGNRIGFGDLRGNQQLVTVGNLAQSGRAALFLADYPMRSRLKLFGTAAVVSADDDPALLEALMLVPEGRLERTPERCIVIDVEAFDWNCAKALVPQYTAEQVRERTDLYVQQIRDLQRQLDEARGGREH